MEKPTFRAPALRATIDVDAHIALLPQGATSKGMFFLSQLDRGAAVLSREVIAKRAGVTLQKYLPFGDYPMADNMRITAVVAAALFPREPLGVALHRLGMTAFDTFVASHMGRVLLGAMELDIASVLRVTPRIYGALFNFGRLEFTLVSEGHGRFAVTGMPIFLETFQAGAFEALLTHTKRRGRVEVALESLSDGALDLRWD